MTAITVDAEAVEVSNIDELTAMINACQSIEELTNAWKSLSKAEKANDTLINAAKEMKSKLTLKTEA